MAVTYDTGALIAADRNERRIWARHRALLTRREVPTVPAPVVAQAWRGSNRQVQLARFLAGCAVEAMDDPRARATGALVARAGTADVVDAFVVEGALRRNDLVVSSDGDDLQPIASSVGRHLDIEPP
ncbi:MAG: PIN domain-containing protein [Actinobacteria bacterium]|nr:PIN domain-containing protein [Actinomycetota bacterium]